MEMEPGVPRGPGALGPEGRTRGLGFRASVFGFRIFGSGFTSCDVGFGVEVLVLEFRVPGFRSRFYSFR